MPILVPDYSNEEGLRSMVSQMADQMADAVGDYDDVDTEDDSEDDNGVTPAMKQRARSALRNISPSMIRQIGYFECLRSFNRNFVRGGYLGMPLDGPYQVSVPMGIALLEVLLEKGDWSLEFVLAASKKDERIAWDRVISSAFLPINDDQLLERYLELFSNLPTDRDIPLEEYQDTCARALALKEGEVIVDRLTTNFTGGPCDVCEAHATSRCARCKSVFYCGSDHQKESWSSHKKACKPLADGTTVNISDADKDALLKLGCKRVPRSMMEAERFEHRIVIRLGRILKKLISHTRNEKMVLYLHQLHLGTLTQHVGGISRVQGVPRRMEEITCLKEIRRTREIPESQKTLAEATGFQIVVLIVLVALLYYLIK